MILWKFKRSVNFDVWRSVKALDHSSYPCCCLFETMEKTSAPKTVWGAQFTSSECINNTLCLPFIKFVCYFRHFKFIILRLVEERIFNPPSTSSDNVCPGKFAYKQGVLESYQRVLGHFYFN